jgi:hypothetical protein
VALVDAGHRQRSEVDVPRARTAAGRRRRSREAARPLRLFRDSPFDVRGGQREAARGLLDSRDPADARHLRRSEAQLGRREELVAREARSGLAEVSQAESGSAVLLLELLSLLFRQKRRPSAGVRKGDRPRNGHVRSETREWFQHLRLRAVEPRRQCVHGHYKSDPDGKAEGRQKRASPSPAQLREDVGDVEHGLSETAAAEQRLRAR